MIQKHVDAPSSAAMPWKGDRAAQHTMEVGEGSAEGAEDRVAANMVDEV